ITGRKGGIPVAVFLDPDCPYCKALQQQLTQNQELEVHEFLMPIPELHPDAQTDSDNIWCSQDRARALVEVMSGETVNTKDAATCDISGLDKINQFALAHSFNATPILIRQDGQIHFGYLSLSELTAWAMASGTQEKTTT
ncbi:MAG: DsbC family protein, partial [Gammaproteobacteria bacterium]